MISGALPETRFAGSLLLYRLLLQYPPEKLVAVGPRPHPQSELLSCRYSYLQPAASARLNLTRLAELKRSLEALKLAGRIPMSRIDVALGDFEPDVVVSVMERRDYVDAAERLCRRRRLPLVLIVHDRLESFELVYPGFRGAQIATNAATYRFASARLCVSPEMAESLSRVYGAPGTVLYPNRSEGLHPRSVSESANLKQAPQLTIGYAGSLSYGYGDRIRELMPQLATAGVRLRIYSHDQGASDVPGVDHAGGSPAAELWERVKQECDAVWLPYGHHPHNQRLYRTHFPSKLTEYMALGMPVLITGPADATGVKWGVAHSASSLALPDATAADILAATERLRTDSALRTALAAGSQSGSRDFDPAAIRAQFTQVLGDVASVARRARH